MPLSPCPHQPATGSLRALILGRARQAAQRFSQAVARDLLEEAESHIRRRIWARKLDPDHSQFSAAVGTALFRLGVDLHRQRARQPVPLPLEHLDFGDRSDQDELSHPTEKLNQARRLLDAIRWRPIAPGGVDLFAVLLLHLRLSLAATFGRIQAHNHDQPLSRMADFVAWCLPWQPDEEDLYIAPGFSVLRDAWAALTTELATPPHRLPVATVCRALDAGAGLKTTRWDQWTCRARQQAKERMGLQTWDDLFAHWLPGQKASAR